MHRIDLYALYGQILGWDFFDNEEVIATVICGYGLKPYIVFLGKIRPVNTEGGLVGIWAMPVEMLGW